jgi:peptidyl-tRNA hydrolase, PTH1 family
MLLLVGLGNPGARYARNRHNIGFMAVDRIADVHGFGPERSRFHALSREGMIQTALGPRKALVLKPQTYMNDSGVSVGEAVQFLKLEPAAVVVFHDELDLVPGKLRIKTGGGHAGHNGLRSIQSRIGADFRRVRMGIGHPGDKAQVLNWVLADFWRAEADWVSALCDACARTADHIALGEDTQAQSRIALLSPLPDPALYRGGERD